MAVKDKVQRDNSTRVKELRNEDPLSGEAGAHPVGAGVGAALGGAATGAVAGMVAGPIGTVVGAIAGGVAGGLAGKSVAESYDPTIEAAYWRDQYHTRPYYNKKYSYDQYAPAYRAGWESYEPNLQNNWAEREASARQRWENEGGASSMTWDEARLASEDAFIRLNATNTKKSR